MHVSNEDLGGLLFLAMLALAVFKLLDIGEWLANLVRGRLARRSRMNAAADYLLETQQGTDLLQQWMEDPVVAAAMVRMDELRRQHLEARSLPSIITAGSDQFVEPR